MSNFILWSEKRKDTRVIHAALNFPRSGRFSLVPAFRLAIREYMKCCYSRQFTIIYPDGIINVKIHLKTRQNKLWIRYENNPLSLFGMWIRSRSTVLFSHHHRKENTRKVRDCKCISTYKNARP